MPFDPSSLPALVGAAKAASIIGCSERKFHYLRGQPSFPLPVEIPGASLRRWRTAELLSWVASLPPATERSPEPLKLRRGKSKNTGRRA